MTDAQTRAGLGAVRSLGRAGYTVIASYPRDSQAPASVWSRHCSGQLCYPDPDGQQSAFREWLCDQANRGSVDAILPVTEASLVGVAAIRKELPSDVLAILPSDQALEYTLSKFNATRLALASGIPCPETVFISDGGPIGDCRPALSGLRFPIIIKTDNYFTPEGGYKGGRHFVATDADQAQRILLDVDHLRTRVIAQQVVRGSGTGAFLLRFGGKTHLRFAHRRLHEVPYTGGASSFRESCQDEELVHLGETLLDAIEYDGVAMVEFRRAAVDGRPYFLEINGRLWGSLALALHCGVDFPAALVQCYQYGSPVRGESPYRAGIRCRSVFPGEVGHLVSIIRARTSREAGPPPSKVKAVVRFILLSLDPRIRHDHFWWSDPLPGIRQAWKTITAMGRTSFRKGYEKLENYRDKRMLKRLREEHESRLRRARYFEMPPRRILFVCYGNICRSPFAAEYWNGRLRERAPTLPPAVSAGLHFVPGRRTPDYLTEAAQVYDVDLRRHESRVVLRSDISSADAIFVMDRMNYRSLMRQFPDVKDRTYFLGLFADTGDSEIGDPYNKGKAGARACCDQLVSSLERLSARILRG